MKKPLFKATVACALLTSLVGVRAHGAELAISVAIPQIDVAEYHRPYVAVWLQSPDRQTIRDIAVWYQQDSKNEGDQWLKDLRQWWRVSGRNQDEPADATSGATRAVGNHTVKVDGSSPALADLPAGQYELLIEAAREKGGRELLRLPLDWPPSETLTAQAEGESELRRIELSVTP